MTTFNCKSSTFIAFLCLAFLLSSTNGADEVYCERLSGVWSGTCFDYTQCSRRCREEEGADGGTCNQSQCWCRYKCCARPSGTWHGPCFDGNVCEKQCQEKENAESGTCTHHLLHCDCLDKC